MIAAVQSGRRRWWLGIGASAGLLALGLGIAFWRILPEPLFDEPQASILLARDGTLLSAKIAADGQWRFPPSSGVPAKYRQALLVFEDKRFESHIGIDPVAIARAVRLNIENGHTVSGASTITMQVARLARARGSNGEGADHADARTFRKKMIEALLALRLETAFSKDEILALYASNAPFGGNVVGLEAAAWRYFGRAPEKLSWAESATLAVLPNSPALVTPGRRRSALLAKRNQLLERLQEAGALSALDLKLALAEPLVDAPLALPNEARHLLESLRARYPGIHRFETTLDPVLQTAASQLVRERAAALGREGVYNVAAVVADNKTFEVLAYVGNSNWSTRNERGFAVDIVRRPRSTGSILKPFLYAAMLDDGQLLPHTLVPDIPTQYAGYMPENFDRQFRGAVPADVALAQSLNVPAVRSLKEFGVERFYDMLTNLGMSTLSRSPENYGLTLILGGAEGTLWDITGMYSNLADLARQITPGPATSCRELQVLKRVPHPNTATPRTSEITPAAAWLTLNALLEAPRPADEAQWKTFAGSRKISWKTGTSWGFRDAWAVGSTSRYTVGVWAGNATGEGKPGLTGATSAAPLMFELHRRLAPAPWFTQPTLAMKQVEVCRDDGFLASGGCESQREWIPANSHFDRLSPNHRLVHLDATARYQVDSNCEPVSNMQHVSWFVLPPAQEYYFRRVRSGYRDLPPFRADCERSRTARDERAPMEFLYPNASGGIYIPVDLDGHKGRTILEAVHRDRGASLYWHLDGRYLGATATFHQMSLDLPPGPHSVTIVDEHGNRLTRAFEVLSSDGHPTDGPIPIAQHRWQ